jgi:iron(II)-dependent oxidoreductase
MSTTRDGRAAVAMLDRTAVAQALDEARRYTEDLLDALDDGVLVRQISPLQSPLVWDLAHIAYFEELWIARRLGGAGPTESRFDDVYDAFSHPRAERRDLELLDAPRARSYAARVRERTLAVLEEVDLDADDPLRADGFAFGLVIQHELQHAETMLQTLQLSDVVLARGPEASGTAASGPREVRVAGGAFELGAASSPWAYDNELPAHEVELAPFAIDAWPVTNAEFLAFVEAGGYRERRLWSRAGLRWLADEGAEHPLFWSRDADGSWWRRRFGRLEPLPPDEPVVHVSHHEADAYARFAGKRLPTEAEWERAAAAAAVAHANLGRVRLAPAAAGTFTGGGAGGVRALLGDVWEWTASEFGGYPGFAAFPYREYSEVFFDDGYRVLRGGSFATHPAIARPSFRNWDHPQRRQIFAGFRCARDV